MPALKTSARSPAPSLASTLAALAPASDPASNSLGALLANKTASSPISQKPDPTSTMLATLMKAFDINGDAAFDLSDVDKLKQDESAAGSNGKVKLTPAMIDALSALIKSLLRSADNNHDLTVDKKDIAAVKASGVPGAANKAALLESLVKSLDINKDNALGYLDLQGVGKATSQPLTSASLTTVLAALKTTLDGDKNGKLNKADVDGLKREETLAKVKQMETTRKSLLSSMLGVLPPASSSRAVGRY